MKIELREFEDYPMVEAGDLVICENGFKYLIGTDGAFFKLISIEEFYISEEEYTFESLMKELGYLGLQRIVRSDNLKLIEL